MSEPHETDEITRELEAIFADYYVPPTEMDLRGVDAATFALGLCYGFDSWQDIRVVANSRRKVAAAERHWAGQHHPSHEFLNHAAGTDEGALEHKRLLDRAHPGCVSCEEQLEQLERGPGAGLGDLDRVDPDAARDAIDDDWERLQPVAVTRSDSGEADAADMLHVPDREKDRPITAEHMSGRGWRITIRDPDARGATVHIRWTGGHESVHVVTFEYDLAVIDADAPQDGARPRSVRIQITGDDR